jgi:hypothetical protein
MPVVPEEKKARKSFSTNDGRWGVMSCHGHIINEYRSR